MSVNDAKSYEEARERNGEKPLRRQREEITVGTRQEKNKSPREAGSLFWGYLFRPLTWLFVSRPADRRCPLGQTRLNNKELSGDSEFSSAENYAGFAPLIIPLICIFAAFLIAITYYINPREMRQDGIRIAEVLGARSRFFNIKISYMDLYTRTHLSAT